MSDSTLTMHTANARIAGEQQDFFYTAVTVQEPQKHLQ